MPSNVSRFEILTYLSVIIAQFHYFLFQFPGALRRGDIFYSLSVDAVLSLITIIFVWAIARNRADWVRWLTLVSFVLIMPWDSWQIFRIFSVNSPSAGLLALIAILQGAGLYFVFTGNARAWFKRPKAEADDP